MKHSSSQRVAVRYLASLVRISREDELGPFYEWARQKYPEVRNPKRDARKDTITFDTLKGYAAEGDIGAKSTLTMMYREWEKERGTDGGAEQPERDHGQQRQERPLEPGETKDNRRMPGPVHEKEWMQSLADKGEKVRAWYFEPADAYGDDLTWQSDKPDLPVKKIIENPSKYKRNYRELQEKYKKLSEGGDLPTESDDQMEARFKRVQKHQRREQVKPKAEHYEQGFWKRKPWRDRESFEPAPSWGEGDRGILQGVTDALKNLGSNDKTIERVAREGAKKDEKANRSRPQSYKEAIERALLWNDGRRILEENLSAEYEKIEEGMQHEMHEARFEAARQLIGEAPHSHMKRFPEMYKKQKENATQIRRTLHAMGVPGFGGRLTRKPKDKKIIKGVQTTAAFYQKYFDDAGIEELPVVFKEGQKGNLRTALRFGAGDHLQTGGLENKAPEELKAKKGEYTEMVPVEELLPLLLFARLKDKKTNVPVPMPVKEEDRTGWFGRRKKAELEAMVPRVADRWLSAA